MYVSEKKNNSYIIIYLILCIFLNYLLLSYLYSNNTYSHIIPGVNDRITGQTQAQSEADTQNNESIPEKSQVKSNSIDIELSPICQLPNLPTGCEAASAAMLLQWAGVDVTKEEIADALPKGELPVQKNGQFTGGNPNKEFVGSPYSSSGFGVFHEPIARIIESYLPGRVKDITGCTFDTLLKIIDSGRPVMVWVTINMAEPKINSTWYDKDGNKVVWKTPEHAMAIVGYNDTEIIVNDPLTGQKTNYNKKLFIKAWEFMGCQGITVEK